MSKLTVDECKRIILDGRRMLTDAEKRIFELEGEIDELRESFDETIADYGDEVKYAEELEQLVRDMMELDQMRHGPFSWEREEKMQDMRGSINARLVELGFVTEVER